MIVEAALEQALRTLKLPTLDSRLTQARAGDLGHVEFLQVLCHDQITRRESQAIARCIRRGQFEQQVSLEEFDIAASPKLPRRRDPRPRRSETAAHRRVGHLDRAGRRGRNPCSARTRPSGEPSRPRGPVHQDQPPAGLSPVVTPTGPGTNGCVNSSGPPC